MARIFHLLLGLVLSASATLAAAAVYFPAPTTTVFLPEVSRLKRPLPPILRVHALRRDEEGTEIRYGIKPSADASRFRIRRDEILLDEDRLDPGEAGNYTVRVSGRIDRSEKDIATIHVIFGEGPLICDKLREKMCFWTGGNLRLRRRQRPSPVWYLSSEFLLSVCSNYSVTYRVVSDGEYFATTRMKNTNADSWVLSLVRVLDPDTEKVPVEISCSVSADSERANVYRTRFDVEVLQEDPSMEHATEKVPSFPKGLEAMSLIASETAEEQSKISPRYPESVEISKFATLASRVTEPTLDGEEVRSGRLRRIAQSGIRFRIEPDTPLGVTEVGGVVYVANTALLRNSTFFRVRISWLDPKGSTAGAVVAVNVTEGSSGACDGRGSDVKAKRPCSQRTSEADCLRTCGVSSGLLTRNVTGHTATSGCQWRNNEKPEFLSVNYRTCSPDLETCPDRFCDPLEEIFPDVCPQDCAANVYGSGNKEGPLPGISSASGVCSCAHDGEGWSCTCDVDTRRRQGKTRKAHRVDKSTEPPLARPSDVNVNVVQASSSEQCGVGCLSSIVGGSVVFIFALSTFLMILYHRRLKKRCPNQSPLKEDMININYEEYIDRSADVLRVTPHNPILHDKPDYYDKKWEFPRYRLTVEETIGEGEFGKVLKARAEGIGGIDGSTIVAVKTLKENAKESELNDLVSEYQLLKEVDHPNIIHLLGACTTLDGPLYVIIEYAKYGSLRNYLRRNRQVGSELHLNEKESETSYMQSITPKDILTFAWQIAKGMAYLTDMKLVHRDLAARNVLVADGLICKISDFGLTRDIYEDDTYLKRSKGRVPVKWMALESLSDHLYTTKSDVWSYGIVLWELVTTGASPYPGIAVQNLFHLLKSGYRMEKPVNCSPELYQILRSCWHENPSHRPTFKSLVSKLEEMLGEGKDYLDLNPRIIENKTYFTEFPDADAEDRALLAAEDPQRRVFKWKFDFAEGDRTCGCPDGGCDCRRYENGNVGRRPRYENEAVEDSSYVQPRGEPKPVNSVEEAKLADPFPGDNLYTVSSDKITCELKKV